MKDYLQLKWKYIVCPIYNMWYIIYCLYDWEFKLNYTYHYDIWSSLMVFWLYHTQMNHISDITKGNAQRIVNTVCRHLSISHWNVPRSRLFRWVVLDILSPKFGQFQRLTWIDSVCQASSWNTIQKACWIKIGKFETLFKEKLIINYLGALGQFFIPESGNQTQWP